MIVQKDGIFQTYIKLLFCCGVLKGNIWLILLVQIAANQMDDNFAIQKWSDLHKPLADSVKEETTGPK